jgi:hypothetical protein
MFRIGQRWQPNPLLRQRGQAPVHSLSAMASLRMLHEDRLRLICASALRGHAYMSDPADAESMARTRDCLRRGKSFCALKDPVRSADRSFVIGHRPRRNELLQRCGGRADDIARRLPNVDLQSGARPGMPDLIRFRSVALDAMVTSSREACE